MTVEIITDTGTVSVDRAIVKASGWVKYRRNGEIHHYPPDRIKSIHEREPEIKNKSEYGTTYDSDVVYQSPHGRV